MKPFKIMDCLEGMNAMPDECIDLVATDPPYGMSFMGKDWDKAVPSVEIWKECLRVLKPGGFAFVMCIPRLDCLSRMAINLEDAGFRVDFTPIYWTYASGFPKALNMGKAVDKKLGVEREKLGINPHQVGRKTDNTSGSFAGSLGDGYEGKVAGQRESYITAPATEEAEELEGSYAGYQPKPAVEVIIVAMKPLAEKTHVDQAMKNKKGVTWLDDARIPFANEKDRKSAETGYEFTGHQAFGESDTYGEAFKRPSQDDMDRVHPSEKGRYPANLIVTDDALNDGKTTKSTGGSGDATIHNRNDTPLYSGYDCRIGSGLGGYGDSGSFSRYFDLDLWWQDRVKRLPKEVQKVFPFLIVPKAAKSEKNKGLDKLSPRKEKTTGDGLDNKIRRCPEHDEPIPSGHNAYKCGCEIRFREGDVDKEKINFHPTVKPVQLMSYLISLGSRDRDIVLDPFLGSGTTIVSANMWNRVGLGFELNDEYAPIIEKRTRRLNRSLDEFFGGGSE